MIWTCRMWDGWAFEILWSYGISAGVRFIGLASWAPYFGLAIDVPLLHFVFWRKVGELSE